MLVAAHHAVPYDAAERLIAACDTSATCTTSSSALLKAMTYASTNVAGTPANWRAGKLETATAVNRAFTLPVSNNTTSGTTTVTETYTYAGRGGRVSTKATAVTLAGAPSGNFSQSFTQSFRWTELGQLDALTYPTCVAAACTNTTTRSVVNAYQGGRLVAVGPYYATEITYHPNGMLKQVTHARRGEHVSAGVAERVDADPNAMGRPYRIYTDGATLPGSTFNVEGDWSNGYYSYDGAGNIKKLLKVSGSSTDTLKPGDDTFTYDKVSRLTQARIATGASTTVSQAYVYDAWGNLTSYGGQPRTIEPSYPTSNHLDDASYDAAGNQTGWIWDPAATPEPRYTYIYDYDRLNQMRYVNGPDGQHRVLAYSADGERIVERDLTGGITTFTLRGLDGALLREVELQNGVYAWVKDYVYRDGQLLASQDRKEGHQHYHLDHLGTTRMLTNRCGERVKRYEQFPFGDTISAPDNDTEKRRFTGHQRDIGSTTNTLDDMDYMHARYYGMKMGRFLAVDQGNGRRAAPQTWNRYGYCRGNPVTRFDPDGAADQVVWDYYFATKDLGPEGREAFETSLSEGLLVGTTATYGAGLIARGGSSLVTGALIYGHRVVDFLSNLLTPGPTITGSIGGVSRKSLEAAARSGGPVIELLTNQTTAPAVGRALSAAAGEGAQALAGAAREGGKLFVARIPAALIAKLQQAGLVEVKTTMMGKRVVAIEYRFYPQASEFVARFFQQAGSEVPKT
ncbi:MAG: RHS repeat domain-containing protein [Thermoanaerobaculaceae bacterium]